MTPPRGRRAHARCPVLSNTHLPFPVHERALALLSRYPSTLWRLVLPRGAGCAPGTRAHAALHIARLRPPSRALALTRDATHD